MPVLGEPRVLEEWRDNDVCQYTIIGACWPESQEKWDYKLKTLKIKPRAGSQFHPP